MVVVVETKKPWGMETLEDVTKIEETDSNYVITNDEEHTFTVSNHAILITR